MLQHYFWLVAFVWMGIEGIPMYLSLVQVFANHISKYMLKYNTAAWGMINHCDSFLISHINI